MWVQAAIRHSDVMEGGLYTSVFRSTTRSDQIWFDASDFRIDWRVDNARQLSRRALLCSFGRDFGTPRNPRELFLGTSISYLVRRNEEHFGAHFRVRADIDAIPRVQREGARESQRKYKKNKQKILISASACVIFVLCSIAFREHMLWSHIVARSASQLSPKKKKNGVRISKSIYMYT